MARPLDELMEVRLSKLRRLEEAGVRAYPNDFKPNTTTSELRERFGKLDQKELEKNKDLFNVAGRVMAIRTMGKACFLDLKDREGQIQVYIRKEIVGDEAYSRLNFIDVGDLLGVIGSVMKTRTGELTILCTSVRLLSKALRPLPEKFHGLQDIETRYRQRYVDLFMNDWVRDLFVKRTKMVKYIRNYLDERGFLEVETPMMQAIPGGAVARPFVTHHNALDMDLYLRIAPELYLKRLLVGGLERVYEINRNFRNEGLSHKHSPEFTMLEFYWAYATFEDLMSLTEDMVTGLFEHLNHSTTLEIGGRAISFSPPFRRMMLADSLHLVGGIPKEKVRDVGYLAAWLRNRGIEVLPSWGLGKLQVEVYDRAVEPALMEPTFVTHHPVETSPLARRNDADPAVVDRFELVIGGCEIANGFSELNDPRDQRSRFEEQVKAQAAGDQEAHVMDEDFLRALEFGMPPAAGEGIGIDRLLMLAAGVDNIKEVILFPLLRPETGRA